MSKKKVLDCLNKLNNYAKLSPDHRWVSVVRHYIKDSKLTSHNTTKFTISQLWCQYSAIKSIKDIDMPTLHSFFKWAEKQ